MQTKDLAANKGKTIRIQLLKDYADTSGGVTISFDRALTEHDYNLYTQGSIGYEKASDSEDEVLTTALEALLSPAGSLLAVSVQPYSLVLHYIGSAEAEIYASLNKIKQALIKSGYAVEFLPTRTLV